MAQGRRDTRARSNDTDLSASPGVSCSDDVHERERGKGIVLGCCLCADGVSRPVGYAPPEPSRMLEVLSHGASRWLGGGD
jgi:hypothetical protein